jgi:hypothetical protein
MRISGIRLKTWLRHPVLAWEAVQRSKFPMTDLDNIERNCAGCRHVHENCKCGCPDFKVSERVMKEKHWKQFTEWLEAWFVLHDKKQKTFSTEEMYSFMKSAIDEEGVKS